ncbi:Pif-3 protein [Gynaephora ruoergensis nucleopolyhedrovirus]|nr:Pif-3 protein [Gynaephora ruoergensis nucleopolyhedrovirus]
MTNYINTFIGFAVLLISLFVVYLICFRQVLHMINAETAHAVHSAANPIELLFERNGIVDCSHTRLPCVADRQCADNCAVQNAIGTIVCDQGFCVNRDAQVAGQRPDDFECDATLGLVKVYIASEFVVNQMCISTYRDIFDDDGRARPYVCDSGTLNVDLTTRPFTLDDCLCLPGHTKMLFTQTALARSIPVCIPDSAKNIYQKIYY